MTPLHDQETCLSSENYGNASQFGGREIYSTTSLCHFVSYVLFPLEMSHATWAPFRTLMAYEWMYNGLSKHHGLVVQTELANTGIKSY